MHCAPLMLFPYCSFIIVTFSLPRQQQHQGVKGFQSLCSCSSSAKQALFHILTMRHFESRSVIKTLDWSSLLVTKPGQRLRGSHLCYLARDEKQKHAPLSLSWEVLHKDCCFSRFLGDLVRKLSKTLWQLHRPHRPKSVKRTQFETW